jgi:hypothetical protein
MTSSAFSTNIMIPISAFTITRGSPKTYTFVRGVEKHTISFCGDCGTTISKTLDGLEHLKGLMTVQAGTLNEDEGFGSMKVDMELYVKNRAEWVAEIDGAKQMEAI